MTQYGAPPTSGSLSSLKPHRGTMVLVFGILGIVTGSCGIGLIFAILATVFGGSDLRDMDGGRMDPTGRGMTTAGRVCGIVGIVISALGALYWIVIVGIFGLAMFGAATSGGAGAGGAGGAGGVTNLLLPF